MRREDVEMLYKIITDLTNGIKVSDVLKKRYSQRYLVLPIDNNIFDVNISTFDFSTRTCNGLKEANIYTIGDIVKYVEGNNGLLKDIKSIGKGSSIEILEAILNYGFERLETEEKVKFLIQFIEDNRRNLL